MKTIPTSQGLAADPNLVQPKGTNVTKTSLTLFASVMILLGGFSVSAQITRTIGTLSPGGTVTITFDVTLNTPFPPNTASVTNQGSVTGTGFGPILTDDPATGAANDPTVTAVTVAPPQLTLVRSGTNGVVSWPSAFTGYALQYTPALLPPPATNPWTFHPGPFTTNAGSIYVTNSFGATNRFFRLFF